MECPQRNRQLADEAGPQIQTKRRRVIKRQAGVFVQMKTDDAVPRNIGLLGQRVEHFKLRGSGCHDNVGRTSRCDRLANRLGSVRCRQLAHLLFRCRNANQHSLLQRCSLYVADRQSSCSSGVFDSRLLIMVRLRGENKWIRRIHRYDLAVVKLAELFAPITAVLCCVATCSALEFTVPESGWWLARRGSRLLLENTPEGRPPTSSARRRWPVHED